MHIEGCSHERQTLKALRSNMIWGGGGEEKAREKARDSAREKEKEGGTK